MPRRLPAVRVEPVVGVQRLVRPGRRAPHAQGKRFPCLGLISDGAFRFGALIYRRARAIGDNPAPLLSIRLASPSFFSPSFLLGARERDSRLEGAPALCSFARVTSIGTRNAGHVESKRTGLTRRVHARQIEAGPSDGGRPCGSTEEVQPCRVRPCDAYRWRASDWTPCRLAEGRCGDGIQTRYVRYSCSVIIQNVD